MQEAPEEVGLLHPGAMGAALGALLVRRGIAVSWVEPGRSPATRRRAEAAGLRPRASLRELVGGCSTILSICPPGAAAEVAEEIVGLGYQGLYVDANAISPRRTRRLAERLRGVGASYADGAIIGPPPGSAKEETTRIYLCGAGAEAAARLLRGEASLGVVVLPGEEGAASALKACYAAWTKGAGALLLAVWAAASGLGVGAALEQEWELSQPGLRHRLEQLRAGAEAKAWRFVAEMEEGGEALLEAGLPDDFSRGAAEVYRRLAGFRERPMEDPGELLTALLQRG